MDLVLKMAIGQWIVAMVRRKRSKEKNKNKESAVRVMVTAADLSGAILEHLLEYSLDKCEAFCLSA